jgi:hypothetical protein
VTDIHALRVNTSTFQIPSSPLIMPATVYLNHNIHAWPSCDSIGCLGCECQI